MKILIMMPIMEQRVFNAAALEQSLQTNCSTFEIYNMVMFADYLVQTKHFSWEKAHMETFTKFNCFVKEDFILIGNCPKEKYKFDLIINSFDNTDIVMDYKDPFTEKLAEKYDFWKKFITKHPLYDNNDSKFYVYNWEALSIFISRLKKGEIDYQNDINTIKEGFDRTIIQTTLRSITNQRNK